MYPDAIRYYWHGQRDLLPPPCNTALRHFNELIIVMRKKRIHPTGETRFKIKFVYMNAILITSNDDVSDGIRTNRMNKLDNKCLQKLGKTKIKIK